MSTTMFVTAPDGLNVRAQPDYTINNILYALPYGKQIEVNPQNMQNGFVQLAEGPGWLFAIHLSTSQPTPSMHPVEHIDHVRWAPPFSAYQRGVHTSAGGWAPDQPQLDAVNANQVKIAFIACYEPNQAGPAISAFRSAGVEHFVLRADVTGTPGSAHDFVERTTPILIQYADILGPTDLMIQIHNEPNMKAEGWTTTWQNGAEFAAWWREVAAAYRNSFPGCKLGFAPMSPGPGFESRLSEVDFVARAQLAINEADWVAVHCYWELADGSDLRIPRTMWRGQFPGKALIATEVGPTGTMTAAAVEHAYGEFAQAGVPMMAWLLNNANDPHFERAAWDHTGLRLALPTQPPIHG